MKPVTNLSDSETAPASFSENDGSMNVAIVGFGTVGSSVARILSERGGEDLRLTHIFNRQIARKRNAALSPSIRWTEDINDVLSSDAHIVIELIGGLEPAGDWIRKALEYNAENLKQKTPQELEYLLHPPRNPGPGRLGGAKKQAGKGT